MLCAVYTCAMLGKNCGVQNFNYLLSISLSLFNMLHKSFITLLICLFDLPTMETDVLKSLTMIVVMSVSPLCVCMCVCVCVCVLYCICNIYMLLSAWKFRF